MMDASITEVKPMAFDKASYDLNYAKQHLKRVALNVRKEYFEQVLSQIPSMTDMTMQSFIKAAIQEKIARDGLDLPDIKP